MKKVDELLARAQDIATGGLQVGVCVLTQDAGGVLADVELWDGVPGSGGKREKRHFDTEQAALDYIEELAATHPPKRGHAPIGKRVIEICPRDPAIIIDDIPSE